MVCKITLQRQWRGEYNERDEQLYREHMVDKGLFTISNMITMLRAPLALLFLVENTFVRLVAVVLSMLSDGLDGYIARRYKMTSQAGKFLDPLMDKFFIFFVLAILVSEGSLTSLNMFAMVFRDVCLCLFGIYVSLFGTWQRCNSCEGIWLSKLTTAFQFFIVIALIGGYTFSSHVYSAFMTLGALSLVELCFYYNKAVADPQ